MNEIIARIAAEHLGVDDIEPRDRDHLDFHDLSVWMIRRALEDAYAAGQETAAHG